MANGLAKALSHTKRCLNGRLSKSAASLPSVPALCDRAFGRPPAPRAGRRSSFLPLFPSETWLPTGSRSSPSRRVQPRTRRLPFGRCSQVPPGPLPAPGGEAAPAIIKPGGRLRHGRVRGSFQHAGQFAGLIKNEFGAALVPLSFLLFIISLYSGYSWASSTFNNRWKLHITSRVIHNAHDSVYI